jgi:Virus neck protein
MCPTSVYFNNQNATREQMLLEDMVIESIKNHGIDIFYIPRTSQGILDTLFGDDPVKYFDVAYKIDMYLETFNDFGGQQEFFSKFGLQIEKTARVVVARRTFEKYVPLDPHNIPKEGDLTYLPTQRKLMEIRFVERDMSFYQLGKIVPYMYALSLETFKYNGEFINTGIQEIDAMCDESALSTNYDLDANSYSTISFARGEVAYQGTNGDVANSSAKGIVVKFDRPNNVLRLRNIKGEFSNTANANVIYGLSTNAHANLMNYDILYNATIPQGEIGDNVIIETEANVIVDFSETNPWGSL